MSARVEPGSRLAGYVIERPIGAGGMGTVFLARDEALDRSVALKLLSPDLAQDDGFRRRFLKEMRLAASLEHPHVCPVYGAGEADGTLYLALRFVEGEDAARLVRREGPLEPERVLALLRDLAGALDHAHERGLTHRDVKPENVLLDTNGNAYLADFGLALPIRRTDTTETGELEGTLLYLAPERIDGHDASSASDEYAFACLAYFLLTGTPPFQRSHEAAILYAHLRDEVPSLGSLGLARLDAVLCRALAKPPKERYPSCAAFVGALGDAYAAREPSEIVWPDTLPRPRTSFLGRERELDELEAIVSEGVRVLTLTGPGGTGKTRLCLELAVRLAPRYEDGAIWVALGAISDPSLVLPQIATAIGSPDLPPEDTIGERGGLLLCLDNLEQLLPDAATQLSSLVECCPNLTLFCTSRSPLRIEWEREYAVPPLAETEALELFIGRAATHRSTRAGADAARAICARVDCLPLAVELASARLRVLTPDALLERLDERLPLLTSGPRDAPARQQTLSATLDWSYDLLGATERELFAKLSVFHGGFTLEAAEIVCEAELEPLANLVDASLVRRRESAGGDARFDLLAVIREYAAGKLATAPAFFEFRERHSDFYAGWVERARTGAEQAQELWSALAREELPNIRSALTWSADNQNSIRLARMVWKLGRFWHRFGLGSEAREWAERALEGIEAQPSEERAGCLNVLGISAYAQADFGRARDAFDASAAIWRDLGDKTELARQLTNLGSVALELDDLDRGSSYFQEAAATAREAGNDHEELAALGNLGVTHSRRGDLNSAAAVFERVASAAGRIGDEDSRAWALSNLGSAREELGEHEAAGTALAEALGLLNRLGWQEGLVYTLSGLARVALALGERRRAARLLYAAERLGEAIVLAWQRDEAEHRDATRARLREALGTAFESAWTEAALVQVEHVIAEESHPPAALPPR